MALAREDVVAGLATELNQFEELLRSLPAEAADQSTRCAGWTVRDVAAHVVGTLADVTAGRFDDIATPAGVERAVVQRRQRSLADLADELHGVAGVAAVMGQAFDDAAWAGPAPLDLATTLGDGVEALWYDAYVHADDIRSAAGMPSERTSGLRGAASHVAYLLGQKGWGPATLDLAGAGTYDVGGGGRTVSADALEFVLAATGRQDPSPLGLEPDVNVYG